MELNLEVGKSYKNASGKKADIIGKFTFSGVDLYIAIVDAGYIFGQFQQNFLKNGEIYNDNMTVENKAEYKLISEWLEPEPPYKVEKYFAEIKYENIIDEKEDREHLDDFDLSYFTLRNSKDELLEYWENESYSRKIHRVYKVTVESIDDGE